MSLITKSYFLLISLLFVSAPRDAPSLTTTHINILNLEPISTEIMYGFAVEKDALIKKKIKWGENLSALLSKYNASPVEIANLATQSKEVFDVRSIKQGKEYILTLDVETPKKVAQLFYIESPTHIVVFNIKDSIFVRDINIPIQIREREITSKVNYTLATTMDALGAPLELVDKVVDIFAWQVDFFRIDANDRFKVIYDEEIVNGESIGVKEIKGAFFMHKNKSHYAIPYKVKDEIDYFGLNGEGLGKAFLKTPVRFSRISSRFSMRRYHPVQKRYKAHLGTDFAAPYGTKIRTVGDGVVVEAQYNKSNGNYVKIRHNSNYTTQYLHMQKIASGIRKGKVVKQGQKIGFVGSTGLARGPHVCFRFWKNGRQVDALNVNLPATSQIPKDKMDDFIKTKERILKRML